MKKPIRFDEIMNYYPTNPSVYQSIRVDLKDIIPFVGAGLSVPFYPLWSKALEKLTENIFYADADKKKEYRESDKWQQSTVIGSSTGT